MCPTGVLFLPKVELCVFEHLELLAESQRHTSMQTSVVWRRVAHSLKFYGTLREVSSYRTAVDFTKVKRVLLGSIDHAALDSDELWVICSYSQLSLSSSHGATRFTTDILFITACCSETKYQTIKICCNSVQ